MAIPSPCSVIRVFCRASWLSSSSWRVSAPCPERSSPPTPTAPARPTATTAIQCRVDYSCVSGACTRTESQPDGTGTAPGVEVVSGLNGSDVFEYSPSTVDPTYIGMTMAFPASGSEDAITLKDGVALRNPAAPSG